MEKNTEFSDVKKLQYLEIHLANEALPLVKNLSVISENYKAAWDLLTKRYQNPRLTATMYMEKILMLPN